MSLLVISEILGLFVNTLTADAKHSLHNRENSKQPIQMQSSKKWKHFTEYFAAFLNFTSILKHFQENKSFIAYLFSKLEIMKEVVRTPFSSEHAKRS